MAESLVTTIIPVHNRAAMLREAVASVIAQTYRPLEIIIVDDGSTDETYAVADALAREHDPLVTVVHIAKGGPGIAREAGRQRAHGAFIQHLDSDDLLLPRKFEIQVAALQAAPECGVAYGWTRYRHTDGRAESQPWKRSGEKIDTMFPAMLRSRWWDTLTPLYRRSVIDRAGAWTDLCIEEDWEYDCRIASQGVRLAWCPNWAAEVREHAGNRATGHLDEASLRDRARAHELIYGHARAAGIEDTPEAAHFARELFLLSRQCGAAGLRHQSARLFALAREASGNERNRLEFRAYAMVARITGWPVAGKLSACADRLRGAQGAVPRAQACLARRLCRLLPPSLAYRLHFTVFKGLLGRPLRFRERVLFGEGVLEGTFAEVEDAYFALHGTMNYAGMTIAAALVRRGDTVFELGANRGTETLSLANLVTPQGRVVAVEADPQTAALLRERAGARRQIIIVQKAVAHFKGTMSWTRNDRAAGSSFLSMDSDGTATVESTTVDHLAQKLGAPAFIFMDIEGSELLCLRGAAQTLRGARPPIFTEVNGAHLRRAGTSARELWQLIYDSGYRAFDAQRLGLPEIEAASAGHSTASDWLLLPEERAGEAVRLRALLRRARFLPRIARLNPLDEER